MAPYKVECQLDEDGVALINFGQPPANALTPPMLEALLRALESAQGDPSVKGIVLAGFNGRFSVGFDINEFAKPGGVAAAFTSARLEELHKSIFDLLEGGPKPTVAAIERFALGGGLELALACNARICTPGTSLGLPELRLGVIPGMGGTQRLPRLVGLQRGLDLILESQIVQEGEAAQLGLVDVVVGEKGELLPTAKRLALEMAEGSRPREFALERSNRLGTPEEVQQVLEGAKERAAGLGDHAVLCIETVQWGLEKGGTVGLGKEAECFLKAASMDYHKARVHLFFAVRAAQKWQVVEVGQQFALYGFYTLRGFVSKLIGALT
ncbi:hypothetical protein N2152v2_008508 [Parachlorella kessleri]